MVRHIAFFVYPGFALLDLSGPQEAFVAADERVPGSYRLSVMSIEGGSVASSTGLKVETQRVTAQGIDTFVVVGDFGMLKRSVPSESVEFIRAASAAIASDGKCLYGGLLAGGVWSAGRTSSHHSLALCCRVTGSVPDSAGEWRSDFSQRRGHVDFCWNDGGY